MSFELFIAYFCGFWAVLAVIWILARWFKKRRDDYMKWK